jgi:hypothetical protein
MQKYKMNIITGTVFFTLCFVAAFSAPFWFEQFKFMVQSLFEFEFMKHHTSDDFVAALIIASIFGMFTLLFGAEMHRKSKYVHLSLLIRCVGFLVLLTFAMFLSTVAGLVTYINWESATRVVLLVDILFGIMIVSTGVVVAQWMFPHESYYRPRCNC